MFPRDTGTDFDFPVCTETGFYPNLIKEAIVFTSLFPAEGRDTGVGLVDMDIQQIGQSFQQGTCGVGGGFLLAGISLILSLALGIGLLRPLVGLISGKDSDKVRGSRVRRLTYAFVFTAISI